MASHTLTSDLVTLDRRDLLVRFASWVSMLVALSSVSFGVIIGLALTKFPPAAYEHGWRPLWAAEFLGLGLVHTVLLVCWLRGRPSVALALVHRFTAAVAFPFAGFSVVSVASNGDGYLISTTVIGGAFLSLLCSQLGIWRLPGVGR